LDGTGVPVDGAELPELDEAFARRIYEQMQLLPNLDNVLYNVQRQGKISFYMTAYGEEATIIGSAAALADDDEVLGSNCLVTGYTTGLNFLCRSIPRNGCSPVARLWH
jgi:2-oxoisovalerate dehydrogenase E1 component alpha subunit